MYPNSLSLYNKKPNYLKKCIDFIIYFTLAEFTCLQECEIVHWVRPEKRIPACFKMKIHFFSKTNSKLHSSRKTGIHHFSSGQTLTLIKTPRDKITLSKKSILHKRQYVCKSRVDGSKLFIVEHYYTRNLKP